MGTGCRRRARNVALAGIVLAGGAPGQAPPPAPVSFPEVTDVDHAALIRGWDAAALARGRTLYQTVCFACHGIDGRQTTVAGARSFAKDPLVHGSDPYRLFKTITFGFATMPQQQWMTPAQRYEVVHYIREAFLKPSNPAQYFKVDDAYLAKLPKPAPGAVAAAPAGGRRPLDFGPVLCSNLGREHPLVLTHCLPGGAAVSYDLHRMRLAGVWTGGHLNVRDTRFTNQRGEAPVRPQGEPAPALETWQWALGGQFDRDLPPRAPAPPEMMRFRGHYVYGDYAVMSYQVSGTGILELPTAEMLAGTPVLRHGLRIDAGTSLLELCVGALEQPGPVATAAATPEVAAGPGVQSGPATGTVALVAAAASPDASNSKGLLFSADAAATHDKLALAERPFADLLPFHLAAAVIGDTGGLRWRIDGRRRIVLEIPPATMPRSIEILRHAGAGAASFAGFHAHARAARTGPDLTHLTRGGGNRWPQPLTVAGKPGEPRNGYALDTIPLPDANPYGAWLRTSALGFFDDGRCAVATYTGDVWIAEGLDRGLRHVTWRRFAAGLYEPFGVLVIDGLVHLTCRDGIKRLHDLNRDGCADYYETFFADPDVSSFFHAFCFDLQRGPQGNLYYAKSGQYTDFKEPGAVVRVTPDGRSFDYFATGFRTPNGMGMMPDGRPLCSDNEGNWIPASKISLCRKGGFYGYVQTHSGGNEWAPDGGRIDHTKVQRPAGFDQPILWLPVSEDNSSGSQLWVDDRRFGPLAGSNGRLLHSSFGKGWVYYLMLQEVGGVTQAACVTLPHQWDAGVQRLRTNPADGQLYGVGISGWQGPRDGKDGCLQRLRFAGGECRMLDDVQATADGLELAFNFDLDPAAATTPGNYQVEAWNYEWHPQYGSKFFSVKRPGEQGTDRLAVAAARLAAGGRRVQLTIPELTPCDQLRVTLDLRDATGRPFKQPFYQTIHRLPQR